MNAFSGAIGTLARDPRHCCRIGVARACSASVSRSAQEDELSPHERQALGHWKAFVEQHPDSPEAAALLGEIEEAQQRWFETQRARSVRKARQALEAGEPAVARVHAERALRFAPEDPAAAELRDEAALALAGQWRERERSVLAVPTADPAAQRALALALLAPGGDVAGTANALLEAAPAARSRTRRVSRSRSPPPMRAASARAGNGSTRSPASMRIART